MPQPVPFRLAWRGGLRSHEPTRYTQDREKLLQPPAQVGAKAEGRRQQADRGNQAAAYASQAHQSQGVARCTTEQYRSCTVATPGKRRWRKDCPPHRARQIPRPNAETRRISAGPGRRGGARNLARSCEVYAKGMRKVCEQRAVYTVLSLRRQHVEWLVAVPHGTQKADGRMQNPNWVGRVWGVCVPGQRGWSGPGHEPWHHG